MSIAVGLVRTAASLPGLMRELEDDAAREPAPLLVSGPPSAAHRLASELARDGDATLVRVLPAAGVRPDVLAAGAALVHVLTGRPTPTDERLLDEARAAALHVVCLALGEVPLDAHLLGLVRARDVVRATEIDAAAAEAVARRVAPGIEEGWLLARRLPVFRRPVGRTLGARHAHTGAALTSGRAESWQASLANDLRLGLRLATGHGNGSDRGVVFAVGAIAAAATAARFALGSRSRSPARKVAIAYVTAWAAGRAAAAYLDRAR